MRLLGIDSSARAGSVTRRLTAKFAEEWMTKESMQMATCNHPSDLVHHMEYPSAERPGLRNDSRVASFANEENERPVSFNQEGTKEDDLIFHNLIESGEKLATRSPWTTVGSLIFQLLLLMAIVVIPLFHADPLLKGETLTMLYLQAPPAAGAKDTKIQAPPKVRSAYTPTSIAIPAPVHVTPEAAPPPVSITGEGVGGVPGGVVGGVPGGVLSEMLGGPRSMPLPAKTPEPTPVKRIRVASGVAEANLIHDVPPQYPPEAGRERIEGPVVLLAVIGTDGSVQDVQVVSGLPILAQAAMEAVKQWRYKPYLLNGAPVEIDSRITINFTLSRG
jgi:protein TonB